ncbi:putative multicopper oxidase, type 1 [Cryomyces antarcticus]
MFCYHPWVSSSHWIHSIGLFSICLLAFASLAFADTIPQDHILFGEQGAGLVKRASTTASTSTSTKVADASCTNGPLTRSCWGGGFSIATDFDQKHPTTGKTVSYNLEITNTTCNPDGAGSKICLLFNGQYPAPTIRASWGDTLSITVKNSMQDNGTSIHWHGIRQLGSNTADGVNGITECPLAPGDTRTYTFLCTQFGTSWYHSHYSAQYGDGAVGAIIIDGPASSNYDIDLGSYIVNEWYYPTSYQINYAASVNLQTGSPPPNADNILVSGTNKNTAGGGKYGVVTMTKGKKYRLRLINTSADNFIRVSLDNHNFTVMTADFIPIKPYTTQWVLLAIGQRYDVVINANQAVGNYWFRANTAADCASGNNHGTGLSIFTYTGATLADPTSTAFTAPSTCSDEAPLAPYWVQPIPSTTFTNQLKTLSVDITKEQVVTNGANLVVWGINTTSINIQWDNPTLSYVASGNTSYPTVYNLIELPTAGIVSAYFGARVIQEVPGTPPIPHPIHLHGHDFFVLGAGAGTFDPTTYTTTLNFATPPRRDTAIMPGGGWLVIAFNTNNPGAWLMHCHIAWHVSEGLGVQFLESKSSIPNPGADYTRVCNNWKTYEKTMAYPKSDSGL